MSGVFEGKRIVEPAHPVMQQGKLPEINMLGDFQEVCNEVFLHPAIIIPKHPDRR